MWTNNELTSIKPAQSSWNPLISSGTFIQLKERAGVITQYPTTITFTTGAIGGFKRS